VKPAHENPARAKTRSGLVATCEAAAPAGVSATDRCACAADLLLDRYTDSQMQTMEKSVMDTASQTALHDCPPKA
jgi:hypothetical protein